MVATIEYYGSATSTARVVVDGVVMSDYMHTPRARELAEQWNHGDKLVLDELPDTDDVYAAWYRRWNR